MKKLLLLSILFFHFNLVAQTDVYITPQSIVLTGQNTIKLDVMIANVNNLHGYSVAISFNNSVVKLNSVVEGTFLSSVASTVFFTNPATIINNVLVDAAILGPNNASGSGKLFSLNFQALSAGTSNINITLVQLFENNGSSIPVDWTSSQIVVPLSINVKSFLQGPFNGSDMSTTLNLSGYIPLIQPYSVQPWNYSGTESVSTSFFNTHQNIVDWILIELRTGTGASTIVERKAGFLTRTGNVVGMDGVSSLFLTKPKGNYFIVIYHRNHIPIMSSISTSLDYFSQLYNFTTEISRAYGVNSMVQLSVGVFGMFAADANGNGQVQNNDRENFWVPQNGQSGYKESDFNLNGQVQNNDNESFWVPNNGKGTQVPN
ncbi:MAG: hypothetical protein IPJ23_19065 [Ignavibacteriales bacterium]|nr:hypothetical protein [Ignavibacteriales bacterium]